MTTGVQFTGTLTANQSQRWYTFNWNPANYILWTVVPTSTTAAGQEVTWSVAVQRVTATTCTYWITVSNLTAATITFEARYAILA
jgi:hypothetical protein